MPETKIELRGRKLGLEKRRVIFQRESRTPQKLEKDLMLILNKSLQKTGTSAYIRFCQVRYAQSGAISELLKKKVSIEDLVKDYFNVLIKMAKSINEAVIRVEALEH